MSKSKNPFPKEMYGVYYSWNGYAIPVRAVERNGWYKTYRLPTKTCHIEIVFQGPWRWYDLEERIRRGLYAFNIPKDEEILVESVNLTEVL